jgi:predicted aspartyl protease
MTITRIVAAFASLMALCSAAGGARAAECAPARLATVQTASLPDGRITVPVTVEGHALSFLLDTGGVSTTVKWDAAKQAALPVRQADRPLIGVGGSMLNFTLAGQNFSLGELRVANKPIYVETRPLPDADGTLGPDILNAYDVEIDLAQGSLSLFSSGYCAPPEWTPTGSATLAVDIAPGGHVRFPVKVDGATVIAVLDTGSTVTILGMQTAALLGIYPSSPGLELLHDAGRYRIYAYPFHTLEIGGVAVKNPRIAIATDGFIPSSDLVLGMDVLRQMRLAIAYGSRRLYVTGSQGN